MKTILFTLVALMSVNTLAETTTVDVDKLVLCESASAIDAPSALDTVNGKITGKLNASAGVTVATVINKGNFGASSVHFYTIKPPFSVSSSTPTVTVQDTMTIIASVCVTLTK